MSRPVSRSSALPAVHGVLRFLVVVNWLYGAGIFILLVALPTRPWIMASLGLEPSPDADRVILGLRAIAVLGLGAVPLHYVVLTRLLAMVETVRAGDPFVAVNAARLHAIAWMLAALQVLSLVIGLIARAISTPAHPIHVAAGFSTNGWLAVILTFLLSGVFAHGTRLRDDLEGTV